MRAGIMTFSRAVNSGSRRWNWKTNPMCWLRKAAMRRSLRVKGSTPSMNTCPESGLSSVPTICRRVVLPAPLGPTMATISRSCTSMSMPLRICKRSNRLVMAWVWIMFLLYE